jgi:hypothetical protein
MDSKFLRAAIFSGRTATGIKAGTILTVGRFWVRTDRCYTVYRGQDGDIDYNNVQAVMDLDDDQVTVPGQGLPTGTIWHYVRRQVSDCGLESADSDAAIIMIDGDGDMIPATPNVVDDLQAEQSTGGKIKLKWRYSRLNEEISPTGFNIYIDSGAGFDFDTPDDAVAYGLGGNGEFEWESEALIDGQSYRFCVRSYTTGAGETQNTNYVAEVADSSGPAAPTGLTASWEVI